MAPRSASTTSSRSPPSDPRRPRLSELEEAEFGTPASLPRSKLHDFSGGVPAPPLPARIPPSLLHTISTSSDPSLTSIDFSNKPLSDVSLVPLLRALGSNSTVTSLNLVNCSLTDTACRPISELLSENRTLQSLFLDNNIIGVEGAAELSTALITNETLKTLTLSGNPLGDRGLIYLAKACGHNSALTTLDMEQCGITQTGRVEQLQNLLLKRRIDNNFESLLERLQDDDYRVTGIDLSGRALGDDGVNRLSEALADNTQVRQLWLRDCAVTDSGAKALASCLEQNMSIVDLFLGGNNIGDEGLSYVCDALRGSNATLVSIEMDDNRVTEHGVRDFISAMGKNNSVLVATFENDMEDTSCLRDLDLLLEKRKKSLNLVSFVVDPENDDEDSVKSGVVNMSVCSSYMPSTYRRAGFRSVASTKQNVPSKIVRGSTTSDSSTKSHVFSIYNKTGKQVPPFSPQSQNVAAARATVQQQSYPAASLSPAPLPPHHEPPVRYSPPRARASPPQTMTMHSPDVSNTKSGRQSLARTSSSKPSQITRAPVPPPPRERRGSALQHPSASLAQPHHIIVKRSSSGSGSRRSSKSNDPPGVGSQALTMHQPTSATSQTIVRVDSVSRSSSQKSKSSRGSKGVTAKEGNSQKLDLHIKAMQVVKEEDPDLKSETLSAPDSEHYSETADHYDKSLKAVCRRVEMMRLMNFFAATHYRSRHFWFWFVPISSCISLAGILSLASAVDMPHITTMILSLCTCFFALVAFVLNFLQSRFGWSSLSESHKSASRELEKVGKKLEELGEYEGHLDSRSVSSRSRANAVRDVYRIDVYLTAMQKCTPDIPMPIDEAFRQLVKRMDYFGKKYPNAIKARLQDYDDDTFDRHDPIPLEMSLDAFDLLCNNIRKYSGFPLFLPDPQNMVGMTTTAFFAKQNGGSPHRRNRRSSSVSYDSRSTYSGRGSGDDSRSSYSQRSSVDSRRSSESYSRGSRTTDDMYTEDSYTRSSRIV